MNIGNLVTRKKYLYSNVPIPRSTQYHRRKREKEKAVAAAAAASKNEVKGCNANLGLISQSAEAEDDDSDPRDFQMESSPESDAEFSEQSETDLFSESQGEFSGCLNKRFSESTLVHNQSNADSDIDLPEMDQMSSLCDEDLILTSSSRNKSCLSTPLSVLTSTTEGDALLMCLALAYRHSFSWTAIVDIVAFVNQLFGCEVVKASKYFFQKYMESPSEKVVYHIYCPKCGRYLGTKKDAEENFSEGCQCGTKIQEINDASTFFLSLNFKCQIKNFLADPVFVEAVAYRFQREKIDEAFEDIYDGELYRELSAPGEVLHERFNMSYTFNTDGCPIGKSSKQTCWPIYVQINELPPKLRSKYMVLAGLYVGKKEPDMKIFLHPFVEEANELSTEGLDWEISGNKINSKIIPLSACVDSVARCKVLNMTQFNGWFGCTICHYKAERCSKTGLRYTLPLNGLDERTHESILVNSVKAFSNSTSIRNINKRSVLGCKGPTPIHNMLFLDLVRGVRPDPMHSMLLGNAKHHTHILEESFGRAYYIGSEARLSAITTRILSIRPPSSVKRSPRSLKEMKLWKATEWRSWMLFYGVVCLYGVIPDEFVIHFSMLSTALHIVLQKSITCDQLERAHFLLLRYVFLYQQYFGKNAMVYNVHLLLHVKRSIECLGPAWTHMAFGFENANKSILQLKKGTSSVSSEMASKYLTFKSMPMLCEKYASSEDAIEFCEQLSGRYLKSYYRMGKTILFGRGCSESFNPEEANTLIQLGIENVNEAVCFKKFLYDGISFSIAKNKATSMDNSYITFNGGIRGRILKACRLLLSEELTVILFVRVLRVNRGFWPDDEFGKMCPIKEIEGEGILKAIRVTDIDGQCVAMSVDHGNYICDVPYGCYGDS